MDKEQAINLAKRYKEMVAEKLPLKALYLYGSYSKGNYRAGPTYRRYGHPLYCDIRMLQ